MKAPAVAALLLPSLRRAAFAAAQDDEDFLPASTPAPASALALAQNPTSAGRTTPGTGDFDMCDNDRDLAAWEFAGGEAGRPSHMEYCTREHGSPPCLADGECVAACFVERYGYTAACAACFGAVPACTVAENCLMQCALDATSEECTACNVPCVERMNECTGLPLVNYDGGGGDGGNDDGATSGPTAAPAASLPASATWAPNYVETAAPVASGPGGGGGATTKSPPNPFAAGDPFAASDAAPVGSPGNSTGGALLNGPIADEEGMPSPTESPTMQPSEEAETPQPTNATTMVPTVKVVRAAPPKSGAAGAAGAAAALTATALAAAVLA